MIAALANFSIFLILFSNNKHGLRLFIHCIGQKELNCLFQIIFD